MAIHHSSRQCRKSGAPWLILIHGLTCDSTDWQPLIELVSDKVHCLSVDLRAHGKSATLSGSLSMIQLARDIADIPEPALAQDNINIIGHSMGTRVGLELALMLQDRVANLVFIDGSRQAEGKPETVRQQLLDSLSEPVATEEFIKRMFSSMFEPKFTKQFGNRVIDRALEMPQEKFTELLAELLAYDCKNQLESLKLVANSTKTRLSVMQSTVVNEDKTRQGLKKTQSSDYLDMLRSTVPDVSIEIAEQTGHFIQLERPELIAAHIDSLI